MHQAKTVSNKVTNKFQKPIDIIGAFFSVESFIRKKARADAGLAIGDVTDCQALLDSLSCIVRDRLSKNASNNSVTGIFKSNATRSKVSIVGDRLPSNHSAKVVGSIPVNKLKSWIGNFKNLVLLTLLDNLAKCFILLRTGLSFLIKKTSASSSVAESSYSNHEILVSGFFLKVTNKLWLPRRERKFIDIPIYKHSSPRKMKYIPCFLGTFLTSEYKTQGSDRTSIFSNWLSTRLSIAWHSALELPLTPPTPSAWLSCRLAPNPLDPLLSNLRSSFGLPISCSLPNQPQIPTILTYFDVYLMYVSNIHSLNIKYIQTIGDFVEALAQTRKHPLARMFSKDPVPRKRGVDRFIHLLALFRGWFHYEYNIFVATLVPTNWNAVPSYADMGGGVMERNSLADVPQGREGWVYLIHAEGTNRYKIGRSVNPIVRVADIQKQSPYPLKLIYSTWTLDAPFDEAQLHQIFSKYRIFGEWFNFGFDLEKHEMAGRIYAVLNYPPTEQLLGDAGLKSLCDFLGVSSPDAIEGSHLILCLYSFAGSRSRMALVENFVRKTLPGLIRNRGISQTDIVDGCTSESLSQFICGVVLAFEALILTGRAQ